MNNLLETTINLLSEQRLEQDLPSIIFSNERYANAVKQFDTDLDALNLSHETFENLYNAHIEQLAITEKIIYKQGLQDGINLIMSLLGKEILHVSY